MAVAHDKTVSRPRGAEGPAAGDVGERRLRRRRVQDRRTSRSVSATRPTCTPGGACSTSPPATATPRSRPPGVAARSSASTTSPRCWTTGVSAPRWKASTSRCSKVTPSRSRSPTRASTPSRRCSASCSRPTSRRLPPSCCGYAGPAARSGSRAGRPPATSARCSGRRPRTFLRLPGLPRPFRWGTEDGLDGAPRRWGLLARRSRSGPITFRYPSAEDFVAFFRTWYGPTLKAFETLDPAGQSALETALVDLARRHDRAPEGALAVDATYLEAIAIRS